jgi:Na+/phosphate symporter
MDGLSAAASIAAIIDISAKVASLCFQYSVAVKDAKRDIERLGRTVTDVKNVLEEVKQLLDRDDKTRLLTTHKLLDSLKEYSQQLQAMKTQLKLGKA